MYGTWSRRSQVICELGDILSKQDSFKWWLELIWDSPRTPGKSCLGKQWVWNLRCERCPSSLSFFANSSTTIYFLTVQQISPISPNTGSAQKAGNKEDCWSIFCKQRTNIQTKTVTRNNLGICSPRSKVDTWEWVMNDEWCAQTPKVFLPVYKYWIEFTLCKIDISPIF